MTAITSPEMTRDLRLKLALARLLPDEIEITKLVNFRWKCGDNAMEVLRDREWDYVVRRICENHHGAWLPPWGAQTWAFLYRKGICLET